MINDSVRGYIVLALKKLGYQTKEIEKVLDELHYVFDVTTKRAAEQYYYNGAWKNEM